MLFEDVVQVLDALDAANLRQWVAGGWGVDALVGWQTRDHRDLDLLVDYARFDDCLTILERLGYAPETDWLPLRLECAAPGGRWVDVHPVSFDDEGGAVLGDRGGAHFDFPPTAFAVGTLNQRLVPCLSAAHQEVVHDGYDPRWQDRHDMALLADLRGKARLATS